jgi:hypothetical protein
MSTVASVSSATSPNEAWAAYRVGNQSSSVSFAQSAKPDVNVGQNVTTAQSSASTTQQGLPQGLLISVSAPSSSNSQATSDYRALRTALQSGNLTAAQQAYTRLQIDLELTYSAQGSSQSGSSASSAAGNGTGLNAIA